MRKLFPTVLIAMTMISMLTIGAHAIDYTFETDETPEYYASTSYEETHGSRYNYGGPNLLEYQIPALEYGSFSTAQTGVMEKVLLPGLQQSVLTPTDDSPSFLPGSSSTTGGPLLPNLPNFTELSEDFPLSNGALGRLSIPAIGVKNYYVWEDTTSSSMKQGLGHFSNTSVWNGNVGVAGHNRGAKYVIGDIKNLDIGDRITYKTSMGERIYAVETVTTIKNNDWSYLESTADNRITLITCVAGDSSRRWCVQAVEIK